MGKFEDTPVWDNDTPGFTAKEVWKVAYFRAEFHKGNLTGEELKNHPFTTLYFIGCGLCTTLEDFKTSFVMDAIYERLVTDHLRRLVEDGYLTEEGGTYTLTPLGQLALRGYLHEEENEE